MNPAGEALQAFLRIRPPPADAEADSSSSNPYLEIRDDKSVVMTAPAENARHHLPKPPHTYSFDRVFAPDSQQHEFFTSTTLPLVDKLLKGENGLMFAYGVSNSGKTYTIQGGPQASLEDRGVLPRALDVVFNSISGLESKATVGYSVPTCANPQLKCQGLADVVLTDEPDISLSSLSVDAEERISDSELNSPLSLG
jgi:kinesin family protein 20